MKVYILIGFFWGEGDEIVNVYSTNELAKSAEINKERSEQAIKDNLTYEFYSIEEYEVK